MIKFKKMHGLGNDFVIIDARDQDINLTTNQIRHICDRNFGVGCDQLVLLEHSNNADIRAIFYNGDGSESGACGNATRCVADIFMKESGQGTCSIETGGGVLHASQADNNMITVDMGEPRDVIDLDLEGNPVGVNMGNPHCVFFVDDLTAVNVSEQGPVIENHTIFPNRTNVEFVQKTGNNTLRQITWERGAGETLACGSGACAVAVAAVTRGLTDRKVEIILDGGTLFIEWRESDNHVLMTGPVAYVFEGELAPLSS